MNNPSHTQNLTLQRLLITPLGRWRTQWLWRLFTLIVLFDYAFQMSPTPWPLSYKGILLLCFVSVITGPRLILMLPISVLMFCYFLPINTHGMFIQVSEEYQHFMIIPLVSSLLVLLTAFVQRGSLKTKKDPNALSVFHQELDNSFILFMRICAVLTMFFAFFHKLNADFFNTQVSCIGLVTEKYANRWRLAFPDWFLRLKPVYILIGEGLIAPLLLWLPKFGIFVTALLMGFVGHGGPSIITVTVVLLSLSFFEHQDKDTILKGLQKYGWLLLIPFLALAFLTKKNYLLKHTANTLVFLEAVVILTIFISLYALYQQWQNKDQRRQLFCFRSNINFKTIRSKTLKAFIIFIALATVLNGLTPFFGLKFRYSFAMLSNLRVDTHRWNHLIVPRWFYLRKYDPYIHLTKISISKGPNTVDKNLKSAHRWKELKSDYLYTPMYFKYLLEYHTYRRDTVDLTFIYEGKTYHFTNATNNRVFLDWLGNTPDTKLFQKSLTLDKPQFCRH